MSSPLSHRPDPVLREIKYIANRIAMDPLLSPAHKGDLMDRLREEYEDYLAWCKTYKGYFRNGRTPTQAPMPEVLHTEGSPAHLSLNGVPSVRVFPDYGGFTHLIDWQDSELNANLQHDNQMTLITPSLERLLMDWQYEFQRFSDYFGPVDDVPNGSMLWVSFDLEGVRLARKVKQHVGERACVIYQKPVECPYCRYDAAREVLADGNLRTLERDFGWHNLLSFKSIGT